MRMFVFTELLHEPYFDKLHTTFGFMTIYRNGRYPYIEHACAPFIIIIFRQEKLCKHRLRAASTTD